MVFLIDVLWRREGTYSLRDIETNDALEREEFEEDLVLQQLWLVAAVEAQTAENGYCGDDEFEDRDPQMCEVDTVGLSAVLPNCEGDDSADPDYDACGNKL